MSKSLAIVPTVALKAEIVSSRMHVGQLHAESVEFVLIALRQEAAYLARKAASGVKLTRAETQTLSEIAMALVALDKGPVRNAQAMLRAVERDEEQRR